MDIYLISSIAFIITVAVLEYFLFVNFQHPRLFHLGIPIFTTRFSCHKNFNAIAEEKRLNRRFNAGFNKVEFSMQSDSFIIFREVPQHKKMNIFYGHMLINKEKLTIILKMYFSMTSIATVLVLFSILLIYNETFFDLIGFFVLIFASITTINTSVFYKNMKKMYI